jgi:glycosyltransferase involved in cell wall biosynthesis
VYAYQSSHRKKICQELQLPDDAVIIGHVGRFNLQKNHAFLLDIFRGLVEQCPKAHLLLVGVGELMDEMKAKVAKLGLDEHVHFLGVRSDVPKLLHTMDLFLFPSFMEGLSVSMVEAQTAGLPCVVSDTIPIEVAMTDLVTFVSLKAPVSDWVLKIQEVLAKESDRTRYPAIITERGYDIQKNAEWLQNYYLEQWQKH